MVSIRRRMESLKSYSDQIGMILKWRKCLTLLKQMSSQLKPANPIKLKWATNSQHTREFQMSHVCYLFPPVSCSVLHHRPPLDVMTSWKVRITLSQSLGGCMTWHAKSQNGFPALKSNEVFFFTIQCVCAALVAALPLCTNMVQSTNSGECQMCNRSAVCFTQQHTPSCKHTSAWFVPNL